MSQGLVRAGFERLDEALALLTSGEVRDPFVAGTAFCALLTSCDRAGDAERAEDWVRLVRDLVLNPAGDQPRALSTHCQLAFGSVLFAVGRLPEAERAILAALGPGASRRAGHRVEATARLAEVRLHQGRLEEAAELLAPIEDHLVAAGPVARVHLERGRAAAAAAVLRRALKQLTGDVMRCGPLIGARVGEEAFHFTSVGPAVPATVRSLAELEPTTLACMHGSSFRGDGGAQLRALAGHYDAVLLPA